MSVIIMHHKHNLEMKHQNVEGGGGGGEEGGAAAARLNVKFPVKGCFFFGKLFIVLYRVMI